MEKSGQREPRARAWRDGSAVHNTVAALPEFPAETGPITTTLTPVPQDPTSVFSLGLWTHIGMYT